MSKSVNRDFLIKVPIFSGLSDQEIDMLLHLATERSYKKQEVIFHADDPGSVLFILKSGMVKVSICDGSGREDILKIVQPLDFFGEMSILDGYHRSATVTAVEKSTALIIERDHILSFIKEHPQVALNMLALLSRRIRKTDEKIASLRFDDAYGKVARALLDIREEQVPVRSGETEPVIFISRQEVADFAGITRETATRVLNDFQRNGCIRLKRGSIALLKETVLKRELF